MGYGIQDTTPEEPDNTLEESEMPLGRVDSKRISAFDEEEFADGRRGGRIRFGFACYSITTGALAFLMDIGVTNSDPSWPIY